MRLPVPSCRPSAEAEREHQRRDFGMQPLLVIHRRQQPDRDDDEGLVLRRPDRHREAVDVRAPQAAGRDIAALTQRLPVRLDAGLEDLRSLRRFALHLRDEGIADFRRQGRGVGRTRGGRGHRDATAGALVQTECGRRAREQEIDEMEAIRNDEADRSRQLLGHFLEPLPDHAAQLRALHHRGAHRHRARPDAIFLIARQIDQLPHPRQRVRCLLYTSDAADE